MTSYQDSVQLTTFTCTNKDCTYTFQSTDSTICTRCGTKTTCKRLSIPELNEYIASFQYLYAHQCTYEEYSTALMERWKLISWVDVESKVMLQLLYYYTIQAIPLTKLSINYTQRLLTTLYQQATSA